MEREWEGREVRGVACWYYVWCWCWWCAWFCVCADVSVYDVAEGEKRQSE